MGNTKKGRGRPNNPEDDLSPYIKNIVKKIKTTETISSIIGFDEENPPNTDQGFINMIQKHIINTNKILKSYGLEEKDFCITKIDWAYNKFISNFYLELKIFIFDEEKRKKIQKNIYIK